MTEHSLGTESSRPWENAWPREQLETLGSCPICAASERSRLYGELVDNSFFCAPGRWTLWQCNSCGVSYLDPRPNPDSIGLAYTHYYTHADSDGARRDYKDLGLLQRIRRRLVNGYINWRFGARAEPASPLGVAAAAVLPNMRSVLLSYYRHLPRKASEDARLLDLGCGGGTYLAVAKSCGWEVVGVDPDPKVVGVARERGYEVHEGGIEVFDGRSELFDAITLNHVIEHLHDPLEVLRSCHRLLKPGGQIYIATPNMESSGRRVFGKNWRGLETPRHLVIFTERSLKGALQVAGFRRIRVMSDQNVYQGLFRASHSMSCGKSPYAEQLPPGKVKWKARWARALGAVNPRRREFLTMLAYKDAR